jgi:hypothetical protein
MQSNEQEKEQRLDAILEGKDPASPGLSSYANEAALSSASSEEIEALLLDDPSMQRAQNDSLRETALRVLSDRHGADYVTKLFQRAKKQDLSWEMWPVGDAQQHLDHDEYSPAERAREAFREHNMPLEFLVPDEVEHFQIDDNGVWNLYLPDKELLHMPQFDILLEDELSGIMEPDHCWNILGVHAIATVEGTAVDIDLVEFYVLGANVIVTTSHPLCPVVHINPDDFIQVILP